MNPPDNRADQGNFGTVFTVARDGYVIAIHYYKHASETGAHRGILWDFDSRAVLANVSFSDVGSGWMTAYLDTPIFVLQNKEYMVSVNINSKFFSKKKQLFLYLNK